MSPMHKEFEKVFAALPKTEGNREIIMETFLEVFMNHCASTREISASLENSIRKTGNGRVQYVSVMPA